MRRHAIAIGLIAAAVIAYEIALMRAFSIGQWYHFAYMVISIALLGFGVSGTFLTLARHRLLAAFDRSLATLAVLFAVAVPLSFALSQKIPFDPFLLVWDRRQLLYLGAYYLALFLPFFFAASAIGLALVRSPEASPYLYGFNMMGSGLGAVLAVGLLYHATAERAIYWIGLVAALAALIALVDLRREQIATRLFGLIVVCVFFLPGGRLGIHVSQYKGLSVSLNLPEARIVAARTGPLGRVDVVSSAAIRHAPGMSLAATRTPPAQLGLFVDAETAGAITRFDGRLEPLEFLDWVSSAAPYHLLPLSLGAPPRVLILGAGGGMETLQALYHRAGRVHAVELDPNVIALARREFGDFAGHLYDRPDVRLHPGEARDFIERTPDRYDLIQISLVDSFAASMAGVYALTENYLYTVEAFEAYFKRLTPSGVLAVTRWLKTPPRDNLKIFATACEALRRQGRDPATHLVLIRSWATATLLVKASPFTPRELDALKEFCASRLFDLSYYPGIRAQETNRFSVLDRELYYEAARSLLGAEGERFTDDYVFAIRPAHDDQPYFFHFFKWKSLPLLLRTMGREWVPFLEWGYIVLVATLLEAAVISFALIVLPLWFTEPAEPMRVMTATVHSGDGDRRAAPLKPGTAPRVRLFIYFFGIGLGYLFVEMVLIQKLTLLLGHPIYAVAVVLAGMLAFSGAGSLVANGLDDALWLRRATLFVAAGALLSAGLLSPLVRATLGWSTTPKFLLALGVLAPLAFFMGMPFSLGLRRAAKVTATGERWVAWAWTVNGCASVLSTILATLLAMAWGFRVVLVVAAGLYLAAGYAFDLLREKAAT